MTSLEIGQTDEAPGSAPAAFTLRQAGLLATLSLAFACVPFDGTQLALAVPTLVRELAASSGASAAAVRWIVEANLIVYAGLMLLGGALSERFGPRRMVT